MRTIISILSVIVSSVMLWAVQPVFAHFGTITPSDDIVTQDDEFVLKNNFSFLLKVCCR
jgi:hypothetical protein